MINGIQEIIKDEVNSVMLRLRVLVVLFGVLRLAESLISARRSCVSDIRILLLWYLVENNGGLFVPGLIVIQSLISWLAGNESTKISPNLLWVSLKQESVNTYYGYTDHKITIRCFHLCNQSIIGNNCPGNRQNDCNGDNKNEILSLHRFLLHPTATGNAPILRTNGIMAHHVFYQLNALVSRRQNPRYFTRSIFDSTVIAYYHHIGIVQYWKGQN